MMFAVFCEELFFRLPLVETKTNRAVFSSALLFALLHVVNIVQLPFPVVLLQMGIAFFLGFFLGKMTQAYESIVPSILSHGLYNALASVTPLPFLYIDPGTGSMLFTVLLGLIGAGIYGIRMLFLSLRFHASGKSEYGDHIPFVIYADDKRYWQTFSPVCAEFAKRGIPLVYLTQSEDDPALKADLLGFQAQYIGKNNASFLKLNFLKADVLLSTTPGLDVYQWKRSKNVKTYVHLPHAASDITLYRMFGLDYYDAVLLSGGHQKEAIRKLEKLRDLPEKRLFFTGIPYLDAMKERKKEKTSQTPTILVAPSWGKNALLSRFGENILEKLRKTPYKIIVRPHPQSFVSEKDLMERLMKQFPEDANFHWNRDADNVAVLSQSDLLISDFSGVIFDFALVFNRPVIYTEPDFSLDPYDHWWLSDPLWTRSALPRIGEAFQEENLSEQIARCLSNPAYLAGIRKVREETWCYPGEGAKRVVDVLCQLQKEMV